jgi:ribose transport system permease protein
MTPTTKLDPSDAPSPLTPGETATSDAGGSRLRSIVKPSAGGRAGLGITVLREYGIVLVVIVLFLVLTFTSSVFLTKTNLLAILDQNAPVGLVAVGTTMCFISGGFDLSVGAVYALTGIIAAKYVGDFGSGGAILVGVLVGLLAGVINGLITTRGRINPFVTTLATSIVIGGIGTVLVGDAIISVSNPGFLDLGNNALLGVKLSIWIWGIFSLLCGFLLQRTLFGRFVYAIGGSEEAARLAGVRVARVRIATYVISGFAAGLAGVIVASRTGSAQPDTSGGLGLAVTAVAGVVIGGTSIMGGEGAIWRTVLGVILLALIGNGFDLLNVNPDWQSIFQGLLIIFAVGFDTWVRRRTA